MYRLDIHKCMEVLGSCGNRLGIVDRVKGRSIRLKQMGLRSDEEDHYLPMAWVDAVGDTIRLNKSCEEVLALWRIKSVGAGEPE